MNNSILYISEYNGFAFFTWDDDMHSMIIVPLFLRLLSMHSFFSVFFRKILSLIQKYYPSLLLWYLMRQFSFLKENLLVILFAFCFFVSSSHCLWSSLFCRFGELLLTERSLFVQWITSVSVWTLEYIPFFNNGRRTF